MKVYRSMLLLLAGALLYLVALDGFCALFTRMPERIELHAADYALCAGEGLDVWTLNQLSGRVVTFEKAVETGALSVVITNGNYPQFGEFDVIRGSFFDSLASDIGQNLAVISEALAFSEFRTLSCIGRQLELNGHHYTVCGVYKKNAILSALGGDGSEVIYIPARSGFDRQYAGETGIQRIMIRTTPEDSPFAAEEIYAQLLALSPQTGAYILRDYAQANRLVAQTRQWFEFVLGVAVALCLLRLALRRAKRCLSERRPGQLDWEKRQLIHQGVAMAVLVAASCLILRGVIFELYLPNGLLPDDSLLDWAHYRTLLLGLIQERNVYTAYRAPGYERLFWWEMAVKVLSLFASFGVFFRCMMGRFWEHGHS